MKILFCISRLSYGGAEKNLALIANHFHDLGNEVTICTIDNTPPMQVLRDGIKVFGMPGYTKKVMKRFQQLRCLVRLIRKESPDLLISFLIYPNFFSIIAGRITNTPVIVSERADPYRFTSFAMRIMYSIYRFASGAVFQTPMAMEYFPVGLRQRSVVIANPVVSVADGIEADYDNADKAIAYAARFEVAQKRQDLMIDAFALVHKLHPEYTLRFYGDGPDEAAMKQYVVDMGLENAVEFHGSTQSVLGEVAKAKVFVLSSDYEGIPNSLLEAMSIGMPCISTDCSPGGAKMLIDSGKNGIIVPRGDKYALSEAICQMIEDGQFAKQCGKQAKYVNNAYSYNLIMGKWEQYCKAIVQK